MKKKAKKVPVPKFSESELVRINIGLRGRQLARNIEKSNALLQRFQDRVASTYKPPTKAQIAKAERDRKRGEKYLAMANALGVYNDYD